MGIDGEAALAQFAVIHDVDSELHLPGDDGVDRALQLVLVNRPVDRAAAIFGDHHFDQLGRPRQASDMGG